MWITIPLARALTGRFLRASAATAAGVAALVTVAALVEGHAPRAETLRTVVAPLAGAFGAAWALGSWRRAGEDIAAAALGRQPLGVVVGLLLLATPLLAMAPPSGAADRLPPGLMIEPGRVLARLPTGTTEWRWTAEGIERRAGAGGSYALLPALPAPEASAGGAPDDAASRWMALIHRVRDLTGRVLALAFALLWLSAAGRPGPARVVTAATLAFVAGHGSSLIA